MSIPIQLDFYSPGATVFLALSGGRDSMFLAHTLLEHKIPFSIAHCNFQLRGAEADADEQFVFDFANSNQIPFYITRFDTMKSAQQNKTSIEEEARNLRYAFFEQLTKEHKIDAFLTAHHQDDQVETILMRIISGTGIQGLTGIPYFREPNYFRPLLRTPSTEIVSYIQANKIEYREDSSNHETKYKRNKIRKELIPVIESLNPNYRVAITHLGTIAEEVEEIIEELFEQQRLEFQIMGRLDLFDMDEVSYLPTMLQYVLAEYSPKKAEIYQIAAKLMTTELKKFECGSIWLSCRKGLLTKISKPT